MNRLDQERREVLPAVVVADGSVFKCGRTVCGLNERSEVDPLERGYDRLSRRMKKNEQKERKKRKKRGRHCQRQRRTPRCVEEHDESFPARLHAFPRQTPRHPLCPRSPSTRSSPLVRTQSSPRAPLTLLSSVPDDLAARLRGLGSRIRKRMYIVSSIRP